MAMNRDSGINQRLNGLTPQSVNKFGGYGIRAKEEAEAQKLISDAIALDERCV